MCSWYQNQSLPRCIDVLSIPSVPKCWQAGRAFSTYFKDFTFWRWVNSRRREQIAVSEVIFLSWRLVRELPQMFFHQISALVLSVFAMCIFFKVSVLCLSSFLACVLSPFNQSASTLSSHHLLCLSAECFQAGWNHINGLREGPRSKTHAHTGSLQTCMLCWSSLTHHE